jgi:gamma-glutamylcyclotransferase (GGCT)/AIG2-like uncharacterized protein YtfP
MNDALTRLITYASLAPGGSNHHVLADIAGQTWTTATLLARIIPNAAYGQYPGAVLDADAEPVSVHLLTSPDLPAHWPRLDEFEGPAYRRTIVPVTPTPATPDAQPRIIAANIYLLAGATP